MTAKEFFNQETGIGLGKPTMLPDSYFEIMENYAKHVLSEHGLICDSCGQEYEYLHPPQMICKNPYCDEYIKTRRLNRPQPRMVAVICVDNEDFQTWVIEKGWNYTYENRIDRFRYQNKIYRAVRSVCDLRSLGVNEIEETRFAKTNKEYEDIINHLKVNLEP